MSVVTSAASAYGTVTSIQLPAETSQNQATDQVQPTQTGGDSQSVAGFGNETDQVKVSQFAQMMSHLQQLSTSDPASFKATAQAVSDSLAQSAKDTSDATKKAAFSDASAMFAQAAGTGSMSSLGKLDNGPLADLLGVSGASASGDTVTISAEGKSLSQQGNPSGNGQSTGSGTSDGTSPGLSSQALNKAAAGSAGQSSGSSGSANSTQTSIDNQIQNTKGQIQKVQSQLQQAQQQAQQQAGANESKQDKVKTLTTQLATLNMQLATLEYEKIQGENGGSGGGGAAG